MAQHPPLGHRDGLAWGDSAEGADLDPLGVDRGHGGFEVTELLLLLAVKPALTTGLLWRFVVAAVLARYRWSLASVEHSLQHQVGWTTEAG